MKSVVIVLTVLLLYLLAACAGAATTNSANWRDPERCARVYAPEAVRVRQSYLGNKWSLRDALEMEIAYVLRDGEPLHPDLRGVVEHAVRFAYGSAYLNLTPKDYVVAYVKACEKRLRELPYP